MYSINSRCVLTLFVSTAVHVGRIAPSPESEAAYMPEVIKKPNASEAALPTSLWVRTKPPNLVFIVTSMVKASPTALTSQIRRECHSSDEARWLPDSPHDQRASMFFLVLTRPSGRMDDRICTLESWSTSIFAHEPPFHPRIYPPPQSASRPEVWMHVPIGSSRVQNHTTWVGFGMFGRHRRSDRIARRPWVRGCATPYTFKFPCRGARKLGAPCTFMSRSRARPCVSTVREPGSAAAA